MPDRKHLARVEAVLASDHVAANRDAAAHRDLLHLSREPLHEELQPSGEVHAALANTLERRVEGRADAVVELADREEPLEVVTRAIETESGEKARRAAVAIHERVDIDELELCKAGNEDRVHVRGRLQPGDERGHPARHVSWCRRCIDDLSRRGAHDEVLHAAVLAWCAGAAAHALDKAAMNLADERFRDRIAAFEVLGDELKRGPVVEKLARVVRVGARRAPAGEEAGRLLEREVRPLDVRGVVRLEEEGAVEGLELLDCGDAAGEFALKRYRGDSDRSLSDLRRTDRVQTRCCLSGAQKMLPPTRAIQIGSGETRNDSLRIEPHSNEVILVTTTWNGAVPERDTTDLLRVPMPLDHE